MLQKSHRRRIARIVLSVCSWQFLCCLAAANGILRACILPDAYRSVFSSINHSRTAFDYVIGRYPDWRLLLGHTSPHEAHLFLSTHLTAGVVDCVLTYFLLIVSLFYVLRRRSLLVNMLRHTLLLPAIGLIVGLVAIASQISAIQVCLNSTCRVAAVAVTFSNLNHLLILVTVMLIALILVLPDRMFQRSGPVNTR